MSLENCQLRAAASTQGITCISNPRRARGSFDIIYIICAVCVASERASCYNCMLCAGVFLSGSFAARRFACDAQQQHESKLIIFADRPLPRTQKRCAAPGSDAILFEFVFECVIAKTRRKINMRDSGERLHRKL
jgi:hypothetical protein